MSSIEKYILITLFVLFVVVFAKWLKRFLRRNEIQEVFPYVDSFDGPISGNNQVMRIELPHAQRVKADILQENGDLALHLFDEELSAGEQLKGLPIGTLKPGVYELRITFQNQVTRRVLEIRAD